MSIIPLIFVFVIFYFLLIRPQQKRQKTAKLIALIKTGDRIVTELGIHGIVQCEGEDHPYKSGR